ncbi:CD276 antigen isoform X2 [Conger conger]|uniref:CD276 antigen isoform X2 n=1 Tax=Conger conger TaxID=82655 RepID=UPI002A5AF353|nr:CD276 antigen isoform X2 [Conger conger]XP_061087169.1 CD276 antigen isoform X2 [Conger conger]
MTSIWILSVVFAQFMCALSNDKLLRLVCPHEIHAVHGEECLLNCSLESHGENVKIESAKCVGEGAGKPEFFHVIRPQSDSTNVSFLMTNTPTTAAGKYFCEILTDSGEDKADVSLIVTAKYSKPAMSSVPDGEIQDEMTVTMFCNASGGYPAGKIRWYDKHDNDWSRSAETTKEETADKRINLKSSYTFKAYSTNPQYRCEVLNSKGEKEGEAELELPFKLINPESVTGDRNSTAITAIVVVIGSVVCGLLFLALLRCRRARRLGGSAEEALCGPFQRNGARRPSTYPILSARSDDSYTMEEDLNTQPESGSPQSEDN